MMDGFGLREAARTSHAPTVLVTHRHELAPNLTSVCPGTRSLTRPSPCATWAGRRTRTMTTF
jgi:hypothetical protein